MNDDYLWDKSGEPDPDVQRLEGLLGRFRLDSAPRPLAVTRIAPRRPRAAWAVALAASIVIAVVAVRAPLGGPALRILADGPVRVGEDRVEGSGSLPVGRWLETGGSRAEVTLAAEIGTVNVKPSSRVKVVEASRTRQRLHLERGSIEAFVLAPPRLFIVDTPAARAVDLGCAYELHVDEDGSGWLRVDSGWVALESGGHDAIVPAGAVCEMRPGVGPGTPRFADAPPALHEALDRLDFGGALAGDLDVILANARPRDTLTLWHLLHRVTDSELERVYGRLAQLSPPPVGVARADVLAGNDQSLAQWRASLEPTWSVDPDLGKKTGKKTTVEEPPLLTR